MAADFRLFGPAHLSLLAAVPACVIALVWIMRRYPALAITLRVSLGLILATNELIWYSYRLRVEGLRLPEALPIQLCDLALWLTVFAALTLKPAIYDVAYFAGLGGSSMALLMPDLWAPLWSYPTVYFLLSHGLVVVTLWVITWSGMARPRPGCLWRTFAILNLFAAAAGAFNAIFSTNYMYLCRKPASASLLDYFGPWPVYIVAGEAFALIVFLLLWLPVRPRTDPRNPKPLPEHGR